MSRVHVSSKDGKVRPCRAQSEKTCTAKGINGEKAKHFNNLEEAEKYVKSLYEEKIGIFTTFDKKNVSKKTINSNDFLENVDYYGMEDFVNKNRANFNEVNSVINYRVDEISKKCENLRNCDPKSKSSSSVSPKIFKEMQRDLQDYKNKTAEIVEVYSSSKFYKPKFIKKSLKNVGNAERLDSFSSESLLKIKQETVTGDDVNVLAQRDFCQKTLLNNVQVKGAEKSKVTNFSGVLKNSAILKNGAVYRDVVWKERLKNDYAESNKNVVIVSSDDYYGNEWKSANFDAVIINTKTREPEGIVEIKTNVNSKFWNDDVPVNVKAEALYYLNVSGLNYADIIVQTSSYETKTYRINKNDPIKDGLTVDDYLKNTVKPWFDSLKL